MSHTETLNEVQNEWHGTLSSYLVGFTLSLLLTGAAFTLVLMHPFSQENTFYSLISLACLQAVGQIIFFFHLGKEAKPRWETIIFVFAVIVLLILALGSLWIMYDLNERTMSHAMSESHSVHKDHETSHRHNNEG